MTNLPFVTADVLFFAFSFLGLALVPAALGRFTWLFPAAFAGLGAWLLAGPEMLQPARNPWLWLLVSQASWILLAADLFMRGRVARVLDAVPLRALMAWSLVHFMGVRHLVAALSGDLPAGFAVEAAAGDLLTGLGALILWPLCRPGRQASVWFRVPALLWNAHALTATLTLSTRILQEQPGLPWNAGEAVFPGVRAYFAGWPGALEALYWIPLMACLHAAIFYKLLRVPRGPAHAGSAPAPSTGEMS